MLENSNIEVPVLLITFNRPEYTRKVLLALRKAKIKTLYVANDAPRLENKKDENARNEIKQLIKEVDWDCHVHTYFHEHNLGCGPAVFFAISWAFETENKLIILEDDCVPAISFFRYCNDLLYKYENNSNIMHIAGSRFNQEFSINDDSYFFSRYTPIWGWATWKRSWELMDFHLSTLKAFIDNNYFDFIFNKDEKKYWFNILNNLHKEQPIRSTWDYQWQYTVFANSGLSIIPKSNLIKNIGVEGAHSKNSLPVHKRLVSEDFSIVKHPDFIIRNIAFDNYHFKKYTNSSLLVRIFKKIRKILLI